MVLGTRGKEVWWVEVGGKKRRVQITLDGAYATGTVVKPLSEGFLDTRPAAVTVLRELSSARGELVQGTASVCSWVRTQRALAPYGAHVSASSPPNPACNSSLHRGSPYS